jgi:glucose-6-phosphate isomerase, archaeal
MAVDLEKRKPDVRRLNDMEAVIYDKEWLKTADNSELYYMYRGIKEENNLRYDITVIPPRMLGQEFVKTKGHEHIGPFGEIYIVLEGLGIYLIQKYLVEDGKEKIEDVSAIIAKKGDVIIIPPYYGHVTINPGHDILKTANWISPACSSRYDLFEKKGGACYFALKNSEGEKIKWLKNNNYKNVPALSFKEPQKALPDKLDFLKGNNSV